ncbi:siderophore ABC transporter substrate-binding protein [Populibacterium corticicola]|uniref:Siderophore ABC transporter substrate-binding protein n=1 Tax=Populibacterium corticicola TaxID=1812826 RepID=A0ABW5XK18_9MICO
MKANFRTRSLALGVIAAFALSACGSNAEENQPETDATTPTSVVVEDNNGEHTINLPLTSVAATDNRTFEVLDSWGVELTAGARALMHSNVSYKDNDAIADLGNHGEPNFEAVVATAPQVIVNGQRFSQFHEDLVKAAPDAVVLELDPREGQPFDAELKRQVTVLGEVFGKQSEAAQLVADFDASIERVKAAYSPDQKVMGVITSGGNIGYVVPSTGRTIGPLFDIFGFTPALEVDGSDDHQGDDISVEAIAQSNPDLIIVMDRDGGFAEADRGEDYQPAAQILENSEALKNVTAVQNGNIAYFPEDTYLNEGISTYTELFNSLADLLEKN